MRYIPYRKLEVRLLILGLQDVRHVNPMEYPYRLPYEMVPVPFLNEEMHHSYIHNMKTDI